MDVVIQTTNAEPVGSSNSPRRARVMSASSGYAISMGVERDIQNEVEETEEARRAVDRDGKGLPAEDLPEGTKTGPDDTAAFTPSRDDEHDHD